MKLLLASTLALLALPLCAQTSGSAPSSGAAAESAAMASPALATLTPEEKTKLMSLHTQVIDQSPDLKKEEMDLMQKGLALQTSGQPPSDADRQAFMAQARAHADKVRAAMIKADPSIEAVFAKITAQVEKLQAQAAAGH